MELITKFLVIFITIFSLYMIYFYFRNKNKKWGNIPPIEISFLMRIYGNNVLKLGIDKVQKDVALINSFIITTDLFIYFNIESIILKMTIMFINTFILILIIYLMLGKIYLKKLYK